ncbi:MAG: VWA domain-containing protein [Caldilineaceae bacterium]|nr:VWA domain-containing protein [Caldilineaceae bacterium]
MNKPAEERQRRWRLVLGGAAENNMLQLNRQDARLDEALGALYDQGEGENQDGRRGGLGGSAPRVARWLGDIREYFPSSVVRLLQQDAIERLNLQQLLLEPELLQSVEADVHLVATLMSLRHLAPAPARESMRQVVKGVVDALLQRLSQPMQQAVRGSLNRAWRNNRPRGQEINWDRTIRANLQHYQPAYQTVVAERLIGYGRQRKQAVKEIILCVDQSGSMATSVVYASIFAAVLASIPAIKTQLILFDTAVVDLTELLTDPVDLLFATQLGGGTDINRAMAYCQTHIDRPSETTLVLISDLYEGGHAEDLVKRVAQIVQSGVKLITLLALNDDGAPAYHHELAQRFATLGVPAFACTPDHFPDLMAAALQQQDIGAWASSQGLVQAGASGSGNTLIG